MADEYYIESDKIKVFPSSRRADSNDQFSRLLSESTLVSIINRLIDREGFVITDPDNFSLSSALEFNIYGYYFRIDPVSTLTSQFPDAQDGDRIWASIELSSETSQISGLTYTELRGQDDNLDNSYHGISFSLAGAEVPNPLKKELLILWKNNGQWEIPHQTAFDEADDYTPVNSTVKFNDTLLAYYGVDGGVI